MLEHLIAISLQHVKVASDVRHKSDSMMPTFRQQMVALSDGITCTQGHNIMYFTLADMFRHCIDVGEWW